MSQIKLSKIVLIVLLTAVFFIPFFSAQNFSSATDEITHLPSGYSYWQTGEITLNPQHPPLVKLAASFPLLFMDLNFNKEDPNLVGPIRNEWAFGSNFLFSNDADKLLLWGRLSVMLISVLLGFYIYKWASEMHRRNTEGAETQTVEIQKKKKDPRNHSAGLIALFLYAFMPVMIANAQFITTDLPLAAFSFIAFYYLWKLHKTGLRKYLIYLGIFLGLALGSKFSATIFLPLVALFTLIYAWRFHADFNVNVRRFAVLAVLAAVPAFAVLYLMYLMPADLGFYFRGLKTVYADWKPGYQFYLNGNFSPDGWRYYFLEAFLIKTPIPFLAAFAFSLIFYKKIKITGWDKIFIFLPMLLFAFITSAKAHEISIRYLIPAIPFAILYAGGGISEIVQNLKRKTQNNNLKFKRLFYAFSFTLYAFSGWYINSAISIYPDYLAYFNEFVSGSDNGYKYLDDSNIEWGQDLKRLKEYQVKHSDTKVIYSWRNSNPEYYGVENLMMADDSGWWKEPKGRYAINTFLLIRMQLLSVQRNDPSLNWLALYEPVDRIGQSFFIYEF